ncbi:MAG: hypothetical protein ACP5I6_04225 [Caldisphaera sp.]|jgi:predicted metallo-beta-lactamase superfamily hydrolase
MQFKFINPFKLSIIGADSLGVRSLATFVNSCNKNIGIDLGASLAPRRYGLPPHQLELDKLNYTMKEIKEAISMSNIIIITHYHYDHYVRNSPELYYGKILLIKDPGKNINRSQSYRAKVFLKDNKVEEHANVSIADNKTFQFDNLKIDFSKPVWHGEENTKIGKLIMLRITCENKSLIYASDVQGPGNKEALDTLLDWKGAELLIISGPPTYFAGYKVSEEAVEKGLNNLKEVIENNVAKIVVVDHHLLRDINYKEKLKEHYKIAEKLNIKLLTSAELMGIEINQLEAKRKELWKNLK